MTDLVRIRARLFDRPIACEAGHYRQLLAGLAERAGPQGAELQIEAAEHAPSSARKRRGYRVENGIARVPIVGELVHDRAYLDASSGLTSYAAVSAKIAAAVADDEARAIALEIDSPGGEAVPALWRAAAEIRAAAAQKTLWAIADPIAYSAAYALAAGAGRIVLARTGGVGSIGCVIAHASYARNLEARGVDVEVFRSGDRKARGGPFEELDDKTRERFRAALSLEYDQFADFVSETRGLDRAAIDALEGDVALGVEAIDRGLADAIAPLDEALAELAQATTELYVMSTPPNPSQTAAAAPDVVPRAEHSQAITAATAAGERAGREAERARISAIMSHEAASDRPALARQLALSTDVSADQAGPILAAAAKETAAPKVDALAKAMAGVPNADIGASAAPDEETAEQMGARIAKGIAA